MCPSSTSSSKQPTERPPDDVLIVLPGDMAPGEPRRLLAIGIVGLFLAVLTGTALVDRIWPTPVPKLLGGEAHAFAEQVRAANWKDGSAARLLETRVRLTSRVRQTISPVFAYWLYRHAGIVKPAALLGEDGWLFHSERAKALGARESAPEIAAAALLSLERACAFEGVEALMLPIPRKSMVEAQHLPGRFNARLDLDRRLPKALRDRGVAFCDLLEVFEGDRLEFGARGEVAPDLFGKSDTHWTPRAQVLAAEAIAKQTSRLRAIDQRPYRLKQVGLSPAGRDLFSFSGIAPEVAGGEHMQASRVEAWKLLDSQGRVGKLASGPRTASVAVLGTSFTDGSRDFVSFLNHFIGTPVFNGSKPGGVAATSLAKLFAFDHRPELAILEIPNHALFQNEVLHGSGGYLASVEYGEVPVVVPEQRFRVNRRFAGKFSRGAESAMLFQRDALRVYHSGEGLLAWRIRGEIQGGTALLQPTASPYAPKFPWPEAVSEVVIPIVQPLSSGELGGLRISLRGRGARSTRAKVDSVELVVLGDPDTQIKLRPGPVTDDGADGWFQAIAPPEEALGKLALLEVELAAAPTAQSPATIEVESTVSGQQPLRLRVPAFDRRGKAFLNLAPFAGQRVAAIRVRGSGAAPERASIAARILSAPGPLPSAR